MLENVRMSCGVFCDLDKGKKIERKEIKTVDFLFAI